MKSVLSWFQRVLSDATARIIAGLLAAFLLATFAGVNAYSISAFLLQDMNAPVAFVLILSLFSMVGLLAGAVPLWRTVARSQRRAPTDAQDRSIELALNQLLPRLSQIEARKQVHVDHEVREYKASTLALFDAWNMSVAQFLSKGEAASLDAVRGEINSQTLNHAGDQAGNWALHVRQVTLRVRGLRSQ